MQPTVTLERPVTAAAIHREKPLPFPLVVPVMPNEQIMEAWKNFRDLKLRLLDASDFVLVNGQPLAKKSAFRKLALAFGISTELVREERIETQDGTAYLLTIKAIAPSGRFMTAAASCHANERPFTKPSDVRATAETRATNRAIANLIGWSAPSVEEMGASGSEDIAPYSEPLPTEPLTESVAITERQRKYIVELLSQRLPDPEELERELANIENLTKSDASAYIKNLLRP